jgi:hypothetical protein
MFLINCPAVARNKLRQALERRPTGSYPPEATYFNPFAFYWPNSHGRYIQWFQENVPNYPNALSSQHNESVLDRTSRLMEYRARFDVYCFSMEPKWRDMMNRLNMDKLQCEYQIGKYDLIPLFLISLNGVIDMQFHSTAYHYMLRPEMVPVVPYPWLPDYEEYDENFDFSLFESSTVVEESATKWWLETRIPGLEEFIPTSMVEALSPQAGVVLHSMDSSGPCSILGKSI